MHRKMINETPVTLMPRIEGRFYYISTDTSYLAGLFDNPYYFIFNRIACVVDTFTNEDISCLDRCLIFRVALAC